MIISEQWLRDWVKVDLDAQQIADCLTLAGLEVDGVQQVAPAIDNLVVGEVLTVEKHPDADKLNLTTVNTGEAEPLNIVCGASNVREGLIVAVATIGAKLPNGLKIKKAKVRGEESFGMLCSASELGLEESSEGLMELQADAEIGQRVDDYLQLNDYLIDIDLTPNRGDCLSVQGIARELKVLADGQYHPLDIADIDSSIASTIKVDVQDDVACPRYLARVINKVDFNAQTPLWMQERLRRSGLSSINPIVDITNYVMLELGQPMHAFDLAKVADKIEVRQSKQGEKITLLDDSQATLDDDTLVIADVNGPIAIAGVMGGKDSAISETTDSIILEAAHFTRPIISGRARRYGLHTDSSHRFERGVDPQLPWQAMQRATELVIEICGGETGAVVEQSNADGLKQKNNVELRFKRLETLLGMKLEQAEVGAILARVADTVTETADGWSVVPPSYRFDIERECDLIEEVARVKGYDNVPTVMPHIAPSSNTKAASESSVNVRTLRNTLIARDYQEAISYSFIDPKDQAVFSEQAGIGLTNPLAENMSEMRRSLLPGLMNAMQFNKNRQHERIRLFEIGAVYLQEGKKIIEKQRVAGVVTGSRQPIQWNGDDSKKIDFYDVKSDVAALLSLTGNKELFIFNNFEHIATHPGQVAKLDLLNGDSSDKSTEVGWLARLHPTVEAKYGFQSNVYAFELDLDLVLQSNVPEFKTVSRFPSVKRDLSVLVDQCVAAKDLIEKIKQAAGSALTKVVLFDVYMGEGIEDGKKSVSFSMILQDDEKTMTDEQSEKVIEDVLALLSNAFGAKLRA